MPRTPPKKARSLVYASSSRSLNPLGPSILPTQQALLPVQRNTRGLRRGRFFVCARYVEQVDRLIENYAKLCLEQAKVDGQDHRLGITYLEAENEADCARTLDLGAETLLEVSFEEDTPAVRAVSNHVYSPAGHRDEEGLSAVVVDAGKMRSAMLEMGMLPVLLQRVMALMKVVPQSYST